MSAHFTARRLNGTLIPQLSPAKLLDSAGEIFS